tara:strand:- start:4907 stop:5032 length:126 start_codon:yes stop_codon:yes gene_type:complete
MKQKENLSRDSDFDNEEAIGCGFVFIVSVLVVILFSIYLIL